MKINIKDMNYENAVIKEGHKMWVGNLEYPVSQQALTDLCKRLPRFYNHMGELFLIPEDYRRG